MYPAVSVLLSLFPTFISSLFGAGPRWIVFVVPGPQWIWLSTSFQRPFDILRRKFQQCDDFSLLTVTNVNITNQICCRHKSDEQLLVSFYNANVLDRKSAPCHCRLTVEMMTDIKDKWYHCLSGIFKLTSVIAVLI